IAAMILEILLMLRSSIVLLEDQPAYTESLWNHSNNHISSRLDALYSIDLFDLPILDELDDLFENFDYRSIVLNLGLADYDTTSVDAPLPETINKNDFDEFESRKEKPKKVQQKKYKQPKYEKKMKYPTKKLKPVKPSKRKY
ncbi:hypothetical protein PMAYCL1PPCAC_04318, partial [Pristionchus mayeri]